MTIDGGWTEAGSLKSGDFAFDIDGGSPTTVKSVIFENVNEKVYNFEVEGNHNYFVSEDGILSHNGKSMPPWPDPSDVDRNRSKWRRYFGFDPDPDKELPGPKHCKPKKSSSRTRDAGPRERNIGANGEEHSRIPKGGLKPR